MQSDEDVRWLLSLMNLYFAFHNVPLPFAFVAFSFFLGLACVIIPFECAFHTACWFDVTLKGLIFHAEFFYVYAILIFWFCMFYNHLYEWLVIYVLKMFYFNFEQEEFKFFLSFPLNLSLCIVSFCSVGESGALILNFCH